MTEPQRRRRRPAVSCNLCRRRKIRCNREAPCSNCLRSRNATCVYEVLSPPPSPRRSIPASLAPAPPQQCPSPVSIAGASTGTGTGTGTSPAGTVSAPRVTSSPAQSDNTTAPPSSLEFEAMRFRIAQLEEQLSAPTRIPPAGPTGKPGLTTETMLESPMLGSYYLHQDVDSPGHACSQSVTHKGRMFGRSHWLHSLLPVRDMFDSVEIQMQAESSSIMSTLERCKHLARVIKLRRAPSWPSPPATELPAREVCDRLIDCYLQTSESLYRILHIPSFIRAYEAIWDSPDTVPNPAFLVQLKLVLAIGAPVYDDTYSLRTPAVHWIYEAQTFLSEPEFKSRITTLSLQINILLLIARQTANIGGTLVWISAGELLRTAMYMGLHKDPPSVPATSTLTREMRRRLWNTVLEIVLQTSKDSGAPPLISMDDFDAKPPGNFDDDQLTEEGAVPRPEGVFTQTSVARALRGTFPARLAVVKYLNDLSSTAPYQKALGLDKELRASHKIMMQALQRPSPQTQSQPLHVGTVLANFNVASFFMILHAPFFSLAYREPAYAFSRMSLLEYSLKIWQIVHPASSLVAHPGASPAPTPDIWKRLATCGHRTFIVATKQTCVSLVMELRAQLEDGESLGTAPFRADLLVVLHEILDWSLSAVKAGETNIKGYLAVSLMIAHTECIKAGLTKDEIPKSLVKMTADFLITCVPLLEDMLAREEGENPSGREQPSAATPAEEMDWADIWMMGSPHNFGGVDPISWAMDGPTGDAISW
ncbi:uncharacterized protein DNG_04704 [Cephalotrichum gorgonifer]|uniref:Zn(2)-C6 fungal-type domain-containing protein n=1 Tax=Cephalotrichum gorgonifer TaxID=2041049 RepID=A0AAE8MWK5_9PEZI|nr:uncharacterized protein DNG_04704 [Cephalotrichum gorgonifer]